MSDWNDAIEAAAKKAEDIANQRWRAGKDHSGTADAVRQAILHLKKKEDRKREPQQE